MNALLIGSLLLSSASFAQSFDVTAFKKLMTERRSTLESIRVGMTKVMTSKSSVELEEGVCEYTQTATQSILRIEGKNMIILSEESFDPAASKACRDAGYEAVKESILFYEPTPTLASDLEDLDAAASSIVDLSRAGEVVTLKFNVTTQDEDGNNRTELMTLKYDLTKPSFRNVVFSEGFGVTTSSVDAPDVDVNAFNLKDVLFCDNNDGDTSDCTRGDFSDVLF